MLTTKELKKELVKRMKVMATERDKLDDILEEVAEQAERYESVMESLQEVIERLSEVV